jgi:hypothetical protein
VEALRLVFAELHAVGLRDTVSLAMPFGRMSEDGLLTGGEASEQAMSVLLNRLWWWTRTLSNARAETPYASSSGS